MTMKNGRLSTNILVISVVISR